MGNDPEEYTCPYCGVTDYPVGSGMRAIVHGPNCPMLVKSKTTGESVNVNDTVYVKLTTSGLKALLNSPGGPNTFEHNVDHATLAMGIQLWRLMHIFGPLFDTPGLGESMVPFVGNNIYFDHDRCLKEEKK